MKPLPLLEQIHNRHEQSPSVEGIHSTLFLCSLLCSRKLLDLLPADPLPLLALLGLEDLVDISAMSQ